MLNFQGVVLYSIHELNIVIIYTVLKPEAPPNALLVVPQRFQIARFSSCWFLTPAASNIIRFKSALKWYSIVCVDTLPWKKRSSPCSFCFRVGVLVGMHLFDSQIGPVEVPSLLQSSRLSCLPQSTYAFPRSTA